MSCSCGGAACGCCRGVIAQTPRLISNTFGQSAISYRCGTQPDFYASLIAALTDSSRPALGALQTREPDDPTIALLDAFACMCDVLTFYTERLAQESYLRTATDPTSLQELGRLLGHRPNPGAAAQTRLAFTLSRPPSIPAGITTDPGVAPPLVPAAVDLPAGLRVMSVPDPGHQSVTFETVEAISAQPQWSSAPVVTTTPSPLTKKSAQIYLAPDPKSRTLKPGDKLLFLGTQSGSKPVFGTAVVDSWDLVVVTAVTAEPNAPILVQWNPPLANDYTSTPPAVLVLRTTASVFGANAPDWNAMSLDFQQQYANIPPLPPPPPNNWPNFEATASLRIDGSQYSGLFLDGSHPEMVAQPAVPAGTQPDAATPAGKWLVTDSASGPQLFLIIARTEAAWAQYAISGHVTEVAVTGDISQISSLTPRELTIYGGGLSLTLADEPDTSAVTSGTTTLTVTADWSAMTAGRTLIISGTASSDHTTTQSEVVTLAATRLDTGPVTELTLNPPGLANSYERDSVVVYGNVATATHGTSTSQVLGSGAATPGQTFQITSTPITYFQDATTSGTSSTLQVTVDGITWTEVPTLYPQGPRDRVYTTDLDAAGHTNVVFGDGARGARPQTGSLNIRASYRHDLGTAGNVDALSLSQPMNRPLGLSAVTNPQTATGGVDPETAAAARASIPLPVLTLGRAVSVQDYADYALAFTGIAKATATVLAVPATGPTIVITVAGDNDTVPSADTLSTLTTSLLRFGDPFAAITVLAYEKSIFQIAGATVAVASGYTRADVLAAVIEAWANAFGFDSRSLRQPVYLSEVITVAQNVPGVLGVDVQSLLPPFFLNPTRRRIDRLIASDASIGPDGLPRPAELLILDPKRLREPGVMP
jgi:predicted phage baseplate assembly protein